ncbi:hypothetical protein QYE76_001522 [Lolium multiflorum]|uniref:RNase H type-1 domain-containing protein n=1 Tax=Lolium multiflorum TaxID=4521 RepID=A0AAD8RN28_LOLMU|nr:hypothetical protein QYE76_001522 [Lolium multiflorum]
MNFDGSKRLEGAGAGVILVSPEGDKLKYVLRMTFPNASNNEAEYEALIHGMKMAKACGATRLKIFGDSQLVAHQVMNQCDAINESMIAYKEVYNELEKLFDGCEINHISRMSNDEADVLANIGNPSKEIFSELDEIFAQGPIFARSFQKTEGEGSGATRRRHHRAARPTPGRADLGCGALVWPPRCPSAYLKPPSRKPQYREPRYGKPSETPPPRIPSRGIQEIASGTLPERDSSPGGLFIAMIASGVMSE